MWREERPRQLVNPVTELFDAAARGYAIGVTCRRCRRTAVFHTHAVWHHFRRKGWSERLREVPAKFRCSGCGTRGPQMELVHEEVTDTSLPLPSPQEWKRELGRRR